MKLCVELNEAQLDAIDQARGVLTREAFVQRASVDLAVRLVEWTTVEQRRGGYPMFKDVVT